MKRIFIAVMLVLFITMTAWADPTQVEFLLSGLHDTSGNPLNGGSVYTYYAGTTTPQSCYLDSAGLTAAANPFVLDTNGQAQVYCNGMYKFVVENSAGVVQNTWDNLGFSSVADLEVALNGTLTFVTTTQFTISGDWTTVLSVGALLKAKLSSGYIYGQVSSSSYSSVTTVNCSWFSGALDATLSAAYSYMLNYTLTYTAAHAGANSDITSLSGLTTPLSKAQGGTGSSTLIVADTANALADAYIDWSSSAGGSKILNKPDMTTYQPLLTNPLVAGTMTTGRYCNKNATANTVDCDTSAAALLTAIGAAPTASPTFTGTVTAPAVTVSTFTGNAESCLYADTSGVLHATGTACGSSGGSGANSLGYYLVSRATNEPANGVNLGALTTGLLKITVGSSIATPSTASDGTDYLSPTTGVTVAQTAAQTIGATGTRLAKLWATDITVTNTITGNSATATSIKGGNSTTGLGSIPYQSDTDTTTLLAPNTVATKKFLSQTGTGTNGAVPAWGVLVSGDIPANAANTSGTAANLSGTPALPNGTTATTQTAGDSSTKLATTAFVAGAVTVPIINFNSFKNVKIAYASTTTATITATVNPYTGTGAVSLTPDLSVSGAGGLDTGAVAASTWYYVFIISGASGTSSLFSLSANSPTMPSGYTYFTRMGTVLTDGSKHIVHTLQQGKRVQYVNASGLPLMAHASTGNTTTPTWTAVSVSAYVPPTSSVIYGNLFGSQSVSVAARSIVAPNNTYGGEGATTNASPVSTGWGMAEAIARGSHLFSFVLESTNIYWATTEANFYLFCMGWEDNL